MYGFFYDCLLQGEGGGGAEPLFENEADPLFLNEVFKLICKRCLSLVCINSSPSQFTELQLGVSSKVFILFH